MTTPIRAMLAQRCPQLFWSLSQDEFPSVNSLSALIFAVHTFQPDLPRLNALDAVYHELYTSRSHERSPSLVEVFAVFSHQPRSFFEGRDSGCLTKESKVAVLRGMQVRRAWKSSTCATVDDRAPRKAAPLSRLPWWVWRHLLVMVYGVPEAWVGDAFWVSPSAPCEGHILYVQ